MINDGTSTISIEMDEFINMISENNNTVSHMFENGMEIVFGVPRINKDTQAVEIDYAFSDVHLEGTPNFEWIEQQWKDFRKK